MSSEPRAPEAPEPEEEEIEVTPIPEPETPDDGYVDPDDTYTEGPES